MASRGILKTAAGLVAVILLLLRVTGFGNRQAIARAEADASRFALQMDSLRDVVLVREHQVTILAAARDSIASQATALRDSVHVLESVRAANQLSIRSLRTTGALQETLRATFPELGDSAWGLLTLPINQTDTIGIEYFTVPAWFAETFAIDHANAESWRAQKEQLVAVDSLRIAVTTLQDSVGLLLAANAGAWRAGYTSAANSYQDLSTRYVAELTKPRIRLGSPVALVAAAGIGLLVGRVVP